MIDQLDLFGRSTPLPEGFRYSPDVLTREQEAHILEQVRSLDLRPFEFHAYTGLRRVASFGWRYDYANRRAVPADEPPAFLLALRDIAAVFADVDAVALRQVLVTEYAPGAGIGWHRDKADFGDVIGVSLLDRCVFRLRRDSGAGWERAKLVAEPRSMYLLSGPSRTVWQHSIPPVAALRYSITFRTLRDDVG
jgi:alkylated DNA repair dioxygenase AlkB